MSNHSSIGINYLYELCTCLSRFFVNPIPERHQYRDNHIFDIASSKRENRRLHLSCMILTSLGIMQSFHNPDSKPDQNLSFLTYLIALGDMPLPRFCITRLINRA